MGGIQSYRLDARTYSVKTSSRQDRGLSAQKAQTKTQLIIGLVLTLQNQSGWVVYTPYHNTCKVIRIKRDDNNLLPYLHIFSFCIFFSISVKNIPTLTMSSVSCGLSIRFTVLYLQSRGANFNRMKE